jgi:hypothetical protein
MKQKQPKPDQVLMEKLEREKQEQEKKREVKKRSGRADMPKTYLTKKEKVVVKVILDEDH